MSWSQPPGSPPPGWYTDPSGPGLRWWDGQRWTEHVSAVEAYVQHPPSAYVPQYPVPQQAAPAAEPQAQAAAPSRPGPAAPPPVFWALPVLVVAMIAGAAGTWASIEVGGRTFATVGGLHDGGDGWLVVIAAVIVAILLAVWVFERVVVLPAVAVAISVAAALVALYHALDPATGNEVPSLVDVNTGWGVWVAFVASLAAAAASAVLAVMKPARA